MERVYEFKVRITVDDEHFSSSDIERLETTLISTKALKTILVEPVLRELATIQRVRESAVSETIKVRVTKGD